MDFVEELREDFLICNICFEEYDDPKQLPCLHTFCRACLSKYIMGKIVETGAEWFPCPFCRKPIQPLHGDEVKTWADSFPTNFFLSQLSCKLHDKVSTYSHNGGDAKSAKPKCSEHPEACLVAYCTRQRKAVCEECCVQTHLDCIKKHVRNRDMRRLVDERKKVQQENLGLLQIKLESLKDAVVTREADLAIREEQLQLQTDAFVSEIRSKFEVLFLEHKRDLSKGLETALVLEKKRLSSMQSEVSDLTDSFQSVTQHLKSADHEDSPLVSALQILDTVEDELKRRGQRLENLRKENSIADINFHPNRNLENVLRDLSFGTITSERKLLSSGGAKPRVQRYISDPIPSKNPSVLVETSFAMTSPRSYIQTEDMESHNLDAAASRRSRERKRQVSPAGAAASSASSPTPDSSTPEEDPVVDYGKHKERRQRTHAPVSQPFGKRVPTTPDFGAALIEESRRSRSLPRRSRPVSEGSVILGRKRAGLESLSDGKTTDRNVRVLEKSPEVIPPPTDNHRKGNPHVTVSNDVFLSNSSDQGTPFDDETSSLASDLTSASGSVSGDIAQGDVIRAEGTRGAYSCDVSNTEPKIVFHGAFMTTHQSDIKNVPGIVGVCAVCKDRVAVSDRWNKCIKLVDIRGRVLDVLSISEEAEPWDLALRKPGLLAVTFPKEQKIRMLDIADGGSRLFYRSHFTTRDGYASLATYDSSSLLASVCPPFGTPKIHIIDYMGCILRAVDCANVSYPRCVDVCGGGEICVSDWTNHDIKIFTREGTTKHCYSGFQGNTDAQLKAPMGLAWDGQGFIFVVDGKTSKVHAVSTSTGQCSLIFSLAEIAGSELKLVTFVEASTDFCRSGKALVVTTTIGAIQVYDLHFRY